MKNIVIFVSYFNYIQNWIAPLYPFLKKKGYKIVIIHMQSLSFGIAPNSSIDKKYITYDIGKMSINNIIKVLIKFKPSAIVFFHFKSFADYIILRISKLIGIKSIYVQHGLYYDKVFKFVIARNISSFLRYIFHFIQYFQLVLKSKRNVFNELHLVYRFLKNNELIETRYDYAVLYSPYSFKIIQNKFQFGVNQVKYSGYPIYEIQREQPKFQENIHSSNRKKVLFIQEKYIPAHTSISYKEEYEYFRMIIEKCKKFNYEFVMRLHPRVDHEFYIKMLAPEKIIIDNEKSLVEQINLSRLVIGNMSTALFGAVLQKKPIIILFYPGFTPLTNIFKEIGLLANDFNELESIIKRPEIWDKKIPLYANFIDKYIGRNNSFEHQAKTVIDIINK